MPKTTWSEECFGTLLARASSPERTVAGWEGGSYLSHRPEVKAPSRWCICMHLYHLCCFLMTFHCFFLRFIECVQNVYSMDSSDSSDSSNLLNVFPGEISDTRPSFPPRSHLRCRRTLSAPWQQASNEDLKGAGAIAVCSMFFWVNIVVLQDAMSFNVLPRTHNMLFIILLFAWIKPLLLYLNSSLYPNSAFGLWKRIFWQATILACPSRYGCLLIRRMAVLEGAFEKCGNLRIYGRSSWECFKKASRLRVQRVDMLAMLANPWPIVKLAGFAWKPHRSTALTRRRWWLW